MNLPNSRDYTVYVSHNPTTGNYFVDFWDRTEYRVSIKVTKEQATNIARDLKLQITQ